jgi:serine/threonine protein kinase
MSQLASSRIGDFEILREIGRGGMGVVYEARQISLDRKVALKVLSGGLGLSPRAVERFCREAAAAAKLHHTNIVPIYATGHDHGTHFYAMELIEGPSLDRVIRQMRLAADDSLQSTAVRPNSSGDLSPSLMATHAYTHLSTSADAVVETTPVSASSLSSDGHYFDTVARIIADVADGLHHAHGQAVIHRDIKPSNLLLSPDGRLSINDFGLARVLEQPGMTQTGEIVGTPAYMSPEQITAGRAPLDHRTDIYSLGATLYELLTLQPPFTGQRRDQIIAQIIHKDPVRPRKLNKTVPVDLETICLKSMEKDPDRRYPTAVALADDLRRYVNRFAISARRAGPLERLTKWIRRRPAVAAALVCALLGLGLAGFFAYRAYRIERQRAADERAYQEQLRAQQRDKALDKTMLAAMSGNFPLAETALGEAELLGLSTGEVRMLRGQLALHRGDTRAALEHLEQAVKLLPGSVAARALLGEAYDDSSDFERFEETYEEVARLEPITPQDYLFKGQLEAHAEPTRALATLDEAIRRHDSPIARLVRTEARTLLTLDTGSPEDADRAVRDAQTAREMLPAGDPLALARCVGAYVAAAVAYEDSGTQHKRPAELERAKTFWELAGRDVETLARFPDVGPAKQARLMYFSVIGDQKARLTESRRITDNPTALVVSLYILGGRENLTEALGVLESSPFKDSASNRFLRVGIVAELDGKDTMRARALYDELAKTQPRSVLDLYPQLAMRLLGDNAAAIGASRQLRENAKLLPRDRREWYGKLLDFNCDTISADELLAAAGPSRFNQCEAHFFIGMTLLGGGQQEKARQHFQKSAATRVVQFFDYVMSQAMLSRLAKDPAWPPWIAAQK